MEVRAVTINRTVQRLPFLAMIKRSMSEFSSASPMARELQRAMRRIWGKNPKSRITRRCRDVGKYSIILYFELCILYYKASPCKTHLSNPIIFTGTKSPNLIFSFFERNTSRKFRVRPEIVPSSSSIFETRMISSRPIII